jgi:peptide-methionine (S)-S-oxide reductase
MGGKMTWLPALLLVLGALAVVAWAWNGFPPGEGNPDPERTDRMKQPAEPPPAGFRLATFGNGCFWCTEAVFQQLKGVYSVVPGYSGGSVQNPTYEQVCTGTTGHAEVIQIRYDPSVISYPELLEVFWKTHDPTTLNRQGNDIGTQYRSVVFYHDEEQKEQAEYYKRQLDASGAFNKPIVTQIVPFSAFYPAEKYHHDYFVNHPNQGYCVAVIGPKLAKFEKAFKDKLKPATKR